MQEAFFPWGQKAPSMSAMLRVGKCAIKGLKNIKKFEKIYMDTEKTNNSYKMKNYLLYNYSELL